MFAVAPSKENVASQLKALIGTKAETAYEKYVLLEQRDKLLRKVRQRIHDVQKAAIFVGTCPDMCPEKERYEREVQKRLSSYELFHSIGNEPTVDHSRAVKDYGRSAADQEEPLSHELRPASVLDMTMNYLLREIAYNEPNDESQLPGWYDFLWKRTRAIRKDMTQQMLEGDVALALLEKCARFHIFCAHRLCELDIGDFDQRMNTENLTKCLQSLKHMYEDMEKKGKMCQNEAEFRSYDVLLSLTDTDVLRQILTYDESVRQSAHIKFALKLFTALQNNNYVVFFRLVRQRATYLQACLVHRYFNDVRIKAFSTLVRSYGANTQLPVAELVRILGFEHGHEAVEFASLYGLTTHPMDGNTLILNRWHVASTDDQQSPTLKRSTVLVESKRKMNLGEILNGGSIPQIALPTPIVSFDENNCYRHDKVLDEFFESNLARDAVKDIPAMDRVDDIGHKMPQQREWLPTTGHVFGSMPSRTIFGSMTSTTVPQPVLSGPSSTVSLTAVTELISSKYLERVISDTVSSLIRLLANGVLQEEKRKEAQLRQQTLLRQAFEKFQTEAYKKTINSTIESFIKLLAEDALRSATQEARQVKLSKEIEIYSQGLRDKLLKDILKQEIYELCTKYYQDEVQRPLHRLDIIRNNLTNILTRRYYNRWRSYVLSKVYRRRLLDDFPCCPMTDVEDMLPLRKKARRYFPGPSYSWMDILDRKQRAGTTGDMMVGSSIHKGIHEQKRLESRPNGNGFNNGNIFISPTPASVMDDKLSILNDIPCQPSPEPSTTATVRYRPRKNCDESAYSWMDVVQSPENHEQAEFSLPKVMISKPVEQTSKPDYFKDIPLSPLSAMKLETLEKARRLRALAEAEKRMAESDVGNWEILLKANDDL